MRQIRKKLVTDEEDRPVAVLIDYEDWKEIERALLDRGGGESTRRDDFERRALAVRGSWTEGDGLEYQRRIRSEWEREQDAG